ncbi:unnamed protein product [Rhodiola kirilowii]
MYSSHGHMDAVNCWKKLLMKSNYLLEMQKLYAGFSVDGLQLISKIVFQNLAARIYIACLQASIFIPGFR